MKYILYIGLNKTGTSTLQVYLGKNQAELLARGIWYPQLGRDPFAQHDLAQAIKEKDLARYRIDAAALKERGVPEGTRTVLICSENFHTVREVGDVAAVFPPACTRVFLYLREHVAYLTSWYQQVAQTRGDLTCSAMDFARLNGYPFMELVDRWRTVYGESLEVRAYDRAKLKDGDIVTDFFAAAFATEPPAERRFKDNNPSISGNLLFVKLVLNHFLTGEESRRIIEELSALSNIDARFTGRIQMDKQEAGKLVHRYREDREALRQQFGIAFKPPRDGQAGNAVPDLLTLKDDVALLLNEAKKRGFAFYDLFLQKREYLLPVLA